MIIFEFEPVWTYVRGANIPHQLFKNKLRYFYKGAQFAKAYTNKKWDGYKYLWYNTKAYTRFPTGLWYLVKEVLEQYNIEYKGIRKFDFPEKEFMWEFQNGITPYPDQLKAIEAAYQYKRGIIEYPTGTGKTAVISAGIIAKFGVPSLFMVHQDVLLHQAKKDIEEALGVEVGLIGDGLMDIKPITCATIQTMYRRIGEPNILRYLGEYVKLVIVDECQNIGTTMWKEVMYKCNAPYRFPISATARREDGATLEIHAVGGRTIAKMTPQEAIEKGYLADVEIEFVPFDHMLYNERDKHLNYNMVYDAQIINNHTRNTLIVDESVKLLNEGRHIIVLVTRIDHGKILKEMFKAKGVNDVEFIWGDTGSDIREDIIEKYRRGEFRVLIGSTIFDVGVDMPIASGLVCAGAGASSIRVPQRVGRVIRRFGKDKKAKVIDIADKNVKFFTKQYRDRYKIYCEEFGKDAIKFREVEKKPEYKGPFEYMNEIMKHL